LKTRQANTEKGISCAQTTTTDPSKLYVGPLIIKVDDKFVE